VAATTSCRSPPTWLWSLVCRSTKFRKLPVAAMPATEPLARPPQLCTRRLRRSTPTRVHRGPAPSPRWACAASRCAHRKATARISARLELCAKAGPDCQRHRIGQADGRLREILKSRARPFTNNDHRISTLGTPLPRWSVQTSGGVSSISASARSGPLHPARSSTSQSQ
jgi:hypothetical protein